jgi:predicted transcriptional regulator of viral defense system
VIKPSNSPEKQLFQIASEQQGYFTASQAIKAGFQDATHPYHIRNGDWIREWRGIYRIARYPLSENGQYVLWSLWSRNRQGIIQGVYSHQTALSLFDLSDIMPEKLHITVPKAFRRHSEIPRVLVLHRGEFKPQEIEQREGYFVSKPTRTIIDLIIEESVSIDIIQQAFREAKQRGYLQMIDLERYRKNKEIGRKIQDCLGKLL